MVFDHRFCFLPIGYKLLYYYMMGWEDSHYLSWSCTWLSTRVSSWAHSLRTYGVHGFGGIHCLGKWFQFPTHGIVLLYNCMREYTSFPTCE